MANDRRRERVASVLQRAVSETIQREIHDPRMSAGLISVTKVEVAGDLRSAKVFISVMGTEAEQRTAWRALKSAHGRIQSLAADRTTLRWTPELIFKNDESLKKAYQINQLIKQAMAELGEGEKDAPDDLDEEAEGAEQAEAPAAEGDAAGRPTEPAGPVGPAAERTER